MRPKTRFPSICDGGHIDPDTNEARCFAVPEAACAAHHETIVSTH
jgi:hypothetical protein